MSTRHVIRAEAALLLAMAVLGSARAADDLASPSRTVAGAEVDLLPTVLSAVDGQLGAGANVWVGRDRVRLRAVGTYIAFPPGFNYGFASQPEGVVATGVQRAQGVLRFVAPGTCGVEFPL